MLRLFSILSLFVATLLPLQCDAQPLEKRASDSGFGIYAFGDKISGFQIYYSKGAAVLGDPTQSNATDMVPVSFTVSGSGNENTFTVHSESKAKTLTDQALYIANDGSDKVGFSSSTERSSGKLTNVWWLYGRYVMTNVEGATFYAEPTSDGWYSLSWSSADQSGTNKVLVTLRTIEPSTNSVLA